MTKKVIIGIIAAQTLLFSYTTGFEDAVKQALKNNKELKAKQFDVEKSKKDVEEAKSYKLGKLEFNENISNTNHAGYVFGTKLAQRRATFADFGFDQFLSWMNNSMNGDVLSVIGLTTDEAIQEVQEYLGKREYYISSDNRFHFSMSQDTIDAVLNYMTA